MSQTRIAPALLFAGAVFFALGPQSSQATAVGVPAGAVPTLGVTSAAVPALGVPVAAVPAMGIPATRIDRLTVSYDDGSGHVRAYSLVCGHDNGGSAADRAADPCAHLDDIGGPVPAVASDQMCSMIYGGPQTAGLKGMWRGHHIAEDYRRTNGCEVARWSRMVPALPVPEKGAPKTPDLRG